VGAVDDPFQRGRVMVGADSGRTDGRELARPFDLETVSSENHDIGPHGFPHRAFVIVDPVDIFR
jgi:hypothetical protein